MCVLHRVDLTIVGQCNLWKDIIIPVNSYQFVSKFATTCLAQLRLLCLKGRVSGGRGIDLSVASWYYPSWSCGKLLVPSPQRSSDRSTALLGGNPWRRPTPGSGWPRLIPRQSSQRFCFGRKIWQTQKQGSKHTDFGWFCRFLVGLLLEMSARKSSSIGVIIRWVNKRCVTYEEFRGVLMDFGALNRSMGSLRTTEKTWGFFVGQIEYSLEWWPSSRRSYRPKAGR